MKSEAAPPGVGLPPKIYYRLWLIVKHYKCNKGGNAIKREDDICLTNFQTKADYFSFMPTKIQPENGWQVEETMHCSQHFSWIARKVVLTAFQSFWKTVCLGKWTFAKMRKNVERRVYQSVAFWKVATEV